MSEKNNRSNDIEATLIVQTINDAVQNCYGVYGFSDKANDTGFSSPALRTSIFSDRMMCSLEK